MTIKDIRDRARINHKDIIGLNFIKNPSSFIFRRHRSQGLRSHVMEILHPDDVEKETHGIDIDGIRQFPRARPVKILRIFRTRLESSEKALKEVSRVKILNKYLSKFIAKSEEFIVGYKQSGEFDILLCGLQEYVEGWALDPWNPFIHEYARSLFGEHGFERFLMNMETFIRNVRKMIIEANHVPDLSGVGNLVITPSQKIRLVDINNISEVIFDSEIRVDDKQYPACDKSMEAIAILERKLLGKSRGMSDIIHRTFFDPQRMRDVAILDEKFHRSLKLSS